MRRRAVITSGAAVAGIAATVGVAAAPASAFTGDHLTATERTNARRPETIAARRLIFGNENVDSATGLLPRLDSQVIEVCVEPLDLLSIGCPFVLEIRPGHHPWQR